MDLGDRREARHETGSEPLLSIAPDVFRLTRPILLALGSATLSHKATTFTHLFDFFSFGGKAESFQGRIKATDKGFSDIRVWLSPSFQRGFWSAQRCVNLVARKGRGEARMRLDQTSTWQIARAERGAIATC